MRVKWDEYFNQHKKTVEKLLTKIRDAQDDEAKKKATKAYNEYMKDHVVATKYYRGMIRELAHQYSQVNETAVRIINGETAPFFAEGYNISADGINGAMLNNDIAIRFDLCDASTVKWLAENPERTLMPPPDKIKIPEDERWNRNLINSQVTQGIVQGESIPKIAARLENITDRNAKACVRRARTMATNAENAGRVQSMNTAEKWGVHTRKQWLSKHDSRTRDTHNDPPPDGVSGEIVDNDAVFSNGCRWPGDHLGPPQEVWNCRCTLKTVVSGFSSNLPKGKEGAIRVWVDGERVR